MLPNTSAAAADLKASSACAAAAFARRPDTPARLSASSSARACAYGSSSNGAVDNVHALLLLERSSSLEGKLRQAAADRHGASQPISGHQETPSGKEHREAGARTKGGGPAHHCHVAYLPWPQRIIGVCIWSKHLVLCGVFHSIMQSNATCQLNCGVVRLQHTCVVVTE